MEIVHLCVEELDSEGKVGFATLLVGVEKDGILHLRKNSWSDLLENHEILQVKLADCRESVVACVPDEMQVKEFTVSIPEVIKPRFDPRFSISPEWFVDIAIRDAIDECICERERRFEEMYG